MPANPGVDMRWGKGWQSAEQRAFVYPFLRAIIKRGIEGLYELEMPLTERKQAVFHSVSRYYTYYGETLNSKRTDYFLKPGASRGRIDHAFWTRTVLHELMHARRQEKIPIDTLLEKAAADGFCYVGDYLFKSMLDNNYKRPEPVEMVFRAPKRLIRALQVRLSAVAHADAWDSQEAKEWSWAPPGFRINALEVVGIAGMLNYINEGHELADGLWAPAEEIVGIKG